MKIKGLLLLGVIVCLSGCGEKLTVKEEDAVTKKAKRLFAEKVDRSMKKKIAAAKADRDSESKAAEGADLAQAPESTKNPESTQNPELAQESNSGQEPDTKLDARTVLSDAIAKGKSESKAVFVHFTADW